MIHDEVDPVIDFSWFYFIGKTKLNLSIKEIGRMTVTTFNKLYGHYKDDWDMEMSLWHTKTTYRQSYLQSQEAEEWF